MKKIILRIISIVFLIFIGYIGYQINTEKIHHEIPLNIVFINNKYNHYFDDNKMYSLEINGNLTNSFFKKIFIGNIRLKRENEIVKEYNSKLQDIFFKGYIKAEPIIEDETFVNEYIGMDDNFSEVIICPFVENEVGFTCNFQENYLISSFDNLNETLEFGEKIFFSNLDKHINK